MKKVLVVSGGPGGPTPEGGTGGRGLPLGDGTFLGIPDPSPSVEVPVVDPGVGLVNEIGGSLERTRISRDEMFSKICQVVAQRSTCWRSQVGALIVKDGRIVSMGYNGPVSGMPACVKPIPPADWMDGPYCFGSVVDDIIMEKLKERTCMGPGCTRSLHAETNAIAFAARAGVSVEGCTMYCSMSPCINCAKVIVNSGIRELKYLEEYRDTSGLELLKKAGIKIEQVEV